MGAATWEHLARLREALVRAHETSFGDSSDLLVGLQWTNAGFGFVDIKHCHGYLGHEFLGLVSGCYPLDRFYRERPEARTLASINQAR